MPAASRTTRPALLAILLIALALRLLLVPLYLLAALHTPGDVRGEILRFSGTITQGDFGQGHALPFLYFVDAEAGMALVWLFGLGGAVILEAEHHATVKAWQYEGMTARSRDLVNRSDLKIWLLDTGGGAD